MAAPDHRLPAAARGPPVTSPRWLAPLAGRADDPHASTLTRACRCGPVSAWRGSGQPGRSGWPGNCSPRACARSHRAGVPARCTAGRASPAGRSTAAGAGLARLGTAGGLCGRHWARFGAPHGPHEGPGSARRGRGPAERSPPLVPVLAAGQFLAGLLIQDHELIGGLVHPYGHHGQALGVFLLAFAGHAVGVLLGSFRVQSRPARHAMHRHLFFQLVKHRSYNVTGTFPVPGTYSARHEAQLHESGRHVVRLIDPDLGWGDRPRSASAHRGVSVLSTLPRRRCLAATPAHPCGGAISRGGHNSPRRRGLSR